MKNKYSEMTNEELNALVISRQVQAGVYTTDPRDCSGKDYVNNGWIWGPGVEDAVTTVAQPDGSRLPQVRHLTGGHRLDYLKNPDITWELLVKNRLTIGPDSWSEDWQCHTAGKPNVFTYDADPLRAVVIAYLIYTE